MVSANTLLNYTFWTINFTVHTDEYIKTMVAVIIHDNKPFLFFYKI